jgi:hypothetical protein
MKNIKTFENFSNHLIDVELYYERYMKSYDIVDDYKGLGPGTLFGGDSGYIDEYEDLIERLKDDMKSFFSNNDMNVDVDKIEFINTGEYLETFIKGYKVRFY